MFKLSCLANNIVNAVCQKKNNAFLQWFTVTIFNKEFWNELKLTDFIMHYFIVHSEPNKEIETVFD